MAGLGSRFRPGWLPGPQTPSSGNVRGRPMYAWATESLPLEKCTRQIFILLASQPEFPDLQRDIEQRYARQHPIVLTVPELTAGQAVTVLRAKEHINNSEPLLVHNADTAFDVDHSWVDHAWNEKLDGALLVFPSKEKRWSFSREDEDGLVAEVREKVVISPWAYHRATFRFSARRRICPRRQNSTRRTATAKPANSTSAHFTTTSSPAAQK